MLLSGLLDPRVDIGIILSGFVLFMLGVNYLGDGLTELAGTKINYYIEKYTNNLFSSIAVGAVITAIMHSSTAATVISISLVRAGMMSLKQAIGISIGANLGTTMTSLVIGLNVEQYGPYLVFIGGIMFLFFKNKTIKNIGDVIFGFGILFVGLQMMSSKLLLLQEYPQFSTFMTGLKDHPWLALGGSTLATVIINSSTAVVGITQKLFVSGEMTMVVASAFVFGSNVGTTLTAILVSQGGSVNTKRAGWFHVVYNILGALLGMIFIVPYSAIITYLNTRIGGTPEMAVGLNHFVFNMISLILVIPFVGGMIKLLEKLIPGEDKSISKDLIVDLDESLIITYPEAAFNSVRENAIAMYTLVIDSIKHSENYLKLKDEEDYEIVKEIEEIINKADYDSTTYLAKLARSGFRREDEALNFSRHLNTLKGLERISDLSVNLVEFYEMVNNADEEFHESALNDLHSMYQLVLNLLERSKEVLVHENKNEYKNLLKDETYLNLIEHKYRDRHFERITEGLDETKIASSLLVDILGTLERVGDHSVNIARNVFYVAKKRK